MMVSQMSTTTPLGETATMGRFSVEFEVANYQDALGIKLGVIPDNQLRQARIAGVVDTGATRLVLPAAVARELGLPKMGETTVKFADGRQAKRSLVGPVQVEIGGRTSVFTAVVEPGRTDALIGAIVLEELDFLADRVSQRLVPRDPQGIVTEVE